MTSSGKSADDTEASADLDNLGPRRRRRLRQRLQETAASPVDDSAHPLDNLAPPDPGAWVPDFIDDAPYSPAPESPAPAASGPAASVPSPDSEASQHRSSGRLDSKPTTSPHSAAASRTAPTNPFGPDAPAIDGSQAGTTGNVFAEYFASVWGDPATGSHPLTDHGEAREPAGARGGAATSSAMGAEQHDVTPKHPDEPSSNAPQPHANHSHPQPSSGVQVQGSGVADEAARQQQRRQPQAQAVAEASTQFAPSRGEPGQRTRDTPHAYAEHAEVGVAGAARAGSASAPLASDGPEIADSGASDPAQQPPARRLGSVAAFEPEPTDTAPVPPAHAIPPRNVTGGGPTMAPSAAATAGQQLGSAATTPAPGALLRPGVPPSADDASPAPDGFMPRAAVLQQDGDGPDVTFLDYDDTADQQAARRATRRSLSLAVAACSATVLAGGLVVGVAQGLRPPAVATNDVAVSDATEAAGVFALAVSDADRGLLSSALVQVGPDGVNVVLVPVSLLLDVAGPESVTLADAWSAGADWRSQLSQTLGLRITSAAVIPAAGAAWLVDNAGGVAVDVPDASLLAADAPRRTGSPATPTASSGVATLRGEQFVQALAGVGQEFDRSTSVAGELWAALLTTLPAEPAALAEELAADAVSASAEPDTERVASLLAGARAQATGGPFATALLPTQELTVDGSAVFLTQWDQARSMLGSRLGEALSADDSQVEVELRNAAGTPGLVLAARQRIIGVEDVRVTDAGNAERFGQAGTVILLREETPELREAAARVAAALDLPDSAIARNEAAGARDLVVMLGSDVDDLVREE